MAVLNVYTDPNIDSAGRVSKLLRALNAAGGKELKVAYATFEIAAADQDGSVYRVFKDMDPDVTIAAILVANDAITAGTDFGVGLYEPELTGAVINKDAFAAGLDLSTAHASLNPKTALDGFAAVAIESYGKRIFEHAGHTVVNKLDAYDIALTADTVGTAAGTVSVMLLFS